MENRIARLTLLIDPRRNRYSKKSAPARSDAITSGAPDDSDYVQQYGTNEQIARMPLNAKANGR